MAYQSGDLQLLDPPCSMIEEGDCDEAHDHYITDTPENDLPQIGGVCLPHSCSKWVIGGPEEIRELVQDLQDALKRLST
jgi:hypothetical protein